MQAYIPEFILAGLAMLLLLAETFCKKTPKFIFGLIGAAGTLAMLPFYMEGLYDNIYIILALVATAVTLLLSVDFRAVINLSSNDSKSQDGTGEFYILPLLACVGITSLCKASNLAEPGFHGSGHQVPDSGRRQHGVSRFRPGLVFRHYGNIHL